MTLRHNIVFVYVVLMIIFALPAISQVNPDDYKKTIESADNYFSKGDYITAKASYEIAVRLAPEEQYPKDRLQQSLDMINVQIYQNNLYTQEIQMADNLFQKKDFSRALQYYQEALSILPGNVYASGKIQEINRYHANDKQVEADYQKSIILADKYFDEGKLDQALTEYRYASTLKPYDTYAKGKAIEIKALIARNKNIPNEYLASLLAAELAISGNNYEEAIKQLEKSITLKPGEPLPMQKLVEAHSLKTSWDSYDSIITSADDYYVNKDFLQAKDKYLQAQSIKPGDDYPNRMLDKIDIMLMEFSNATDLQPEEAYPKDKIREIEALPADAKITTEDKQQALENYNKEQVDEFNADTAGNVEMQAIEGQYQDLIATADEALKAKDYQKALADYEASRKLKPGEIYAQEKIGQINTILAEITAKEIAAKEIAAKKIAVKEALDKQYQAAIAAADKTLQSKDYEKALADYQSALALKPGEQYAQGKVLEIKTIMAEQAKQLEIDQQYVKTIATADEYLKNNNYEEARTTYQQALAIKPEEQYAEKQIVQIDHTLESMVTEREQAYQSAVAKADVSFEQKDYEMAKLQYIRVLELKPDDTNAQQKLKQVSDQLMIKRQLVQQEYDLTIIHADKFFASKTYDNAIDSYRAASRLIPDEEYPRIMVNHILKLLIERSIVQINKDPVLIPNNTTHKFDFIPVPARDRKGNYIFFRARNLSNKEFKLIVSFGEAQSKNGGVIVKVPTGDSNYEIIVRISGQYKWFSDDNNWITCFPEGGDIEVSLIQISYSD